MAASTAIIGTRPAVRQQGQALSKRLVFDQILQNSGQINRYGISKIGLFGSFVRGEQKPDSDVDILVDFKDGQETFDNFMGLCFLLDDLFAGRRVEVVTMNGLSPHIGPHILKEVEYVEIAN
ncbi:MAG: nucleotidyltransferase family protein [Saprospiraceae bacterium]